MNIVQKRGRVMANKCYLCGEEEESCDHIPLHCTKTREVWNLVFTLFGVAWVLPSTLKEVMLS